jgi:hypothetical protein
MYRNGHLKLDELGTRRYRLDQINDAITDMREGRNIGELSNSPKGRLRPCVTRRIGRVDPQVDAQL